MDVNIRTEGRFEIIDLKGEVDLYSSPLLREHFFTLIKAKRPVVLVNLKGVTYIDSSGLATLIEAMQKMGKYGGRLCLAGLSRHVRDIFEVSRLENVFTIFSHEAEALESLK